MPWRGVAWRRGGAVRRGAARRGAACGVATMASQVILPSAAAATSEIVRQARLFHPLAPRAARSSGVGSRERDGSVWRGAHVRMIASLLGLTQSNGHTRACRRFDDRCATGVCDATRPADHVPRVRAAARSAAHRGAVAIRDERSLLSTPHAAASPPRPEKKRAA